MIRGEEGMSLVETAIVALVFMTTLSIAGAALVSANRTTSFAEQETEALVQGRLALSRIERDLRSALALDICGTSAKFGNCLELTTRLADGRTVGLRYELSGNSLTRCEGPVGLATCSGSVALVGKVSLKPGETVFSCDAASQQIAAMKVLLRLTPLGTAAGSGEGELELRTTARSRNLASSTC